MFGLGMFGWMFRPPLAPGTPAPDFTLPDESGRRVTLSDFRGTSVVLVFYPGDDTPVCRKQLCEFRDRWEQVQGRNAVVLGVNPRGGRSHARFRDRHAFPFPLLVDSGQRVAGLYAANGLFVRRTVYLVGPDGIIRYGQRGKPDPAEVLASAP
jgi:peroxiredoxin Q/BCP